MGGSMPGLVYPGDISPKSPPNRNDAMLPAFRPIALGAGALTGERRNLRRDIAKTSSKDAAPPIYHNVNPPGQMLHAHLVTDGWCRAWDPAFMLRAWRIQNIVHTSNRRRSPGSAATTCDSPGAPGRRYGFTNDEGAERSPRLAIAAPSINARNTLMRCDIGRLCDPWAVITSRGDGFLHLGAPYR